MIQTGPGVDRTSRDGCRRYVALAVTFDTRSRVLDSENDDAEYEPAIKDQWRRNRLQIHGALAAEFGSANFAQKVIDFRAIDVAPFSVDALHNTFLRQIRDAFCCGSYYPALVGAGALGERILNQLVVELRVDFSDHPATTPEVAKWKSFTKWDQCTDALAGWGVLTDAVVEYFMSLRHLRNRAVHYNRALDGSNARDDALTAVKLIQEIIGSLFDSFGGPPKFIPGTLGHTYVSSEFEQQPLFQHFYKPACVLVSPHWRQEMGRLPDGRITSSVFDDEGYQEAYPVLTDDEFALHCSDVEAYRPSSA